ncbi:MAG: phosphoribosylglycinamide formyltransferase [Planctomycetota bacterium]
MTARRLRLAVLISGSGRTLENFVALSSSGDLSAEVALVVSSRPNVGGLDRAERFGLPHVTISRRAFEGVEAFSAAITETIRSHEVDLVTLAGFLSFYQIPPELEGRVMNIHPSLLPAFGGPGCYGDRVHRAVLDSGVKVTGCTVHFANNEYDAGPIIVQRAVPVLEDDDPSTLAARVFEQECEAYPEAIRLYAEDRLRIEGHRVRILS